MPHPQQTPTLATFVEKNGPKTGAWGSLDAYMTSLLKAWFGEAATQENDFCFDHLPRIDGGHSIYPTMVRMIEGQCKGFRVDQHPDQDDRPTRLRLHSPGALIALAMLSLADLCPSLPR